MGEPAQVNLTGVWGQMYLVSLVRIHLSIGGLWMSDPEPLMESL